MMALAAHRGRKSWSRPTNTELREMDRGSVRGCPRVSVTTLTALPPSVSTSPHTNWTHVKFKVGKEGLEPFIFLLLYFCIKLK